MLHGILAFPPSSFKNTDFLFLREIDVEGEPRALHPTFRKVLVHHDLFQMAQKRSKDGGRVGVSDGGDDRYDARTQDGWFTSSGLITPET